MSELFLQNLVEIQVNMQLNISRKISRMDVSLQSLVTATMKSELKDVMVLKMPSKS